MATKSTPTGDDIRAMRRTLGWSQEFTARRADVSTARLGQIEAGFSVDRPSGVRDRIVEVLTEALDAEAVTAA
ncbi:MAG: helix-turn-helix domain-containing protein [Solirubrobacteraceae bacterium]